MSSIQALEPKDPSNDNGHPGERQQSPGPAPLVLRDPPNRLAGRPEQEHPDQTSYHFSPDRLDQKSAVKWLAKAWMSEKDTWDGTNWLEDPISRYKIVFEAYVVPKQTRFTNSMTDSFALVDHP